DEPAARGAPGVLVHVEGRRTVRHGDLHRVVHQVAGDYRVLPLRADADMDVAGGVAMARLAVDAGGDLVVGLDEVRHPRAHNRVDAFDQVGVGVHPVVAERGLPSVVF